MISPVPRHLLSVAAVAALIIFTGPLHSQLRAEKATLPEEPRTQLQVGGTASEGLAAEIASSSAAEAHDQMQATQPQTQTQAQPQTQAAPEHPLTPEEEKKESEEQLQRQLHQRMAGVVPNFNAVLGGTALPLSPSQKMHAAFRSAIDPYQFGLALLTSGYGQATDSHSSIDPDGTHHGYAQGWGGFGCRYGANYVDQFNGTIIGNGILPVILHQDPRYYRMGESHPFKQRFIYSLETTVIARGDNGKRQPNYSNVLGNLVSGGISNFYYPKAERGVGLTIEQGLEVTAEGSFGALLIEFYPDIRRHFSKHHGQ